MGRKDKQRRTAGATSKSERRVTSRAGDEWTVPRWLPAALYGLLTFVLFREFIFSDLMLFGSDTLFGGGYVARELYAEALASGGGVPGWAPHYLGGTPFLEALTGGDSLYPPSLLLLLITEPYRALGWKLILHVFLAGLFMFGWIRAIGGSRTAALFAGAAYLLAPFFIGFIQPGHDGKIFVITLAPLLFWAVERHFQKPAPHTVAAIGLVITGIIYTTHFQMAYFLFGGVGLFGIFRAIQVARNADPHTTVASAPADEAETAKPRGMPRAGALRFGLFLMASILGATGAAYQLFPAADYVTEYSRRVQTTDENAGETGRAWSSSYSMHPEEAMSLIVPEFPGNGAGGSAWANNTYWGRNGLKNNHEYAGLVVLLLAAVSFAGAARRPLRLFLVGLGLLSFTFSLGANTPVWGFFYDVVPGIRLFRSVGMAIFLFGFSAITLAALGLDRVIALIRADDERELARVQRILLIATGGAGVLALLIVSGAFTSLWTTVVYRGIDARRLQMLAAYQPFLAQGAFFTFVITAATTGTVWAVANRKVALRMGVVALVALAIVDSGRIAGSFIETFSFHEWAAPDPNIQALLDRERGSDEPYRLYTLESSGQAVTPAMHGIELAAGHHPNDLSRYRELIGMVGSGLAENLFSPNVLALLNVKYILWPDIERGPAPQLPVVSRTQLGQGQVYHTLLEYPGLPRARLVANAVVKSDAEAVEYILSAAHDPANEVVLAQDAPLTLGGGTAEGSVTWLERSNDLLRLQVESDRAALLVVADNWYPAWKATVDGDDAEVLRAYHTLRAVAVPAGSSVVEMRYDSDLLANSFRLSLFVLLSLLALGGAGLWLERKRRGAAGGRVEPDADLATTGASE